MKKIIFLCFSVLFANFIWSQTVSVIAPTNVEVGLNNNFQFRFFPISSGLYSGYQVSSWQISSVISNMNNSGSPYYNDNSMSNTTMDMGSGSNVFTPIKWEDNSTSTTDVIYITVNVRYREISSGNWTSTEVYKYSTTKNGAYYLGYDVNINRIFTPTITNTTFASCSVANVQICATNYATANQFNWVVSGGTITSGQGSSCINVTPTLTGSLTVSCTAKRSNGLASYTRTATKTINSAPFTSSATINGNATFCTSSSYTIDGLLPNQTVEWSLSKTPLFGTLSSLTGSSTTVTAGVKQGDISLIAKISNSCGEFVTITKELTIGANGLNAILTTPSGYPYSYPYYNVPENCSAPLYVFKTSSENTNLNNPTKQMQFTCNGVTVVKQSVGNYYFFLYASDFNISEGNSFTVEARVGNSCGFATSTTTFTLYRPTPCECGVGNGCLQLARIANPKPKNLTGEKIEKKIEKKIEEKIEEIKIYPNPSNDVINIELGYANSSNHQNISINIYNTLGVQVDSFNINENKAILDVRKYAKGVYIIKISNDEIEESHQFIVK